MPAHRLTERQILNIFRYRRRELSIDKIFKALDGSISRNSVAKYVQHFDRLDPHIRERELEYEWTEPERARIPWEATTWVVDCLHDYEKGILKTMADVTGISPEADETEMLGYNEVFSNRWATWCWRVHLAAPNLSQEQVLGIAIEYAIVERANDFLPIKPRVEMGGWDDWLRWLGRITPDTDLEEWKLDYDKALRLDTLKRVPDVATIIDVSWYTSSKIPHANPAVSWHRIMVNRLNLGLLNQEQERVIKEYLGE
jgi:hypothetical protein